MIEFFCDILLVYFIETLPPLLSFFAKTFKFPFLKIEISPEELADAFKELETAKLTSPLLEAEISAFSAITF